VELCIALCRKSHLDEGLCERLTGKWSAKIEGGNPIFHEKGTLIREGSVTLCIVVSNPMSFLAPSSTDFSLQMLGLLMVELYAMMLLVADHQVIPLLCLEPPMPIQVSKRSKSHIVARQKSSQDELQILRHYPIAPRVA
jgi:hypothetical protein